MAQGTFHKCLFSCLVSILTISAAGTQVGFSFDARRNSATSPLKAISFLKQNKVPPSRIRLFVADHRVLSSLSNTGVSVDLFLNQTQVNDLINSKTSAISWLKSHVLSFLPHVNIKSIIASGSSNEQPGKYDLSVLPSTLKSIHSTLRSFYLDDKVKISVAFSLSFLERLDRKHQADLHKIFNLIRKAKSYVIVEASISGELSMGDQFVQSMIEKAILASSVVSENNVPMVLTIRSSAVPSAIEVAQYSDKISRSLINATQIKDQIGGLYAEVSPVEEFQQRELRREEEQMFHASHRGLRNPFHHKTPSHDSIDPPTTIFPTKPITNPSKASITFLSDNPAPTIVTVPAVNPVTITPANPVPMPVTVPSTTPVTVPPTNPGNSPSPVTAPITVPGTQPITNPVTTYPAPAGGVPVTTPVTTPVTPPATSNSPAVPGQSWCVAKTGAMQSALQSALDYACGIGGAECSLIQQGGSCYNPNTLQSHASYAFNSYYQKNPVPTSCDFGGTATIVSTNPSTGSCVFPSSSSLPSSPSSTSPPTPPASTNPTPTPTTATSSYGAPVSGSGSPPMVLNSSNPASATTTVFGSESPPGVNSPASMSAPPMRPLIGYIILVTSIMARKLIVDM